MESQRDHESAIYKTIGRNSKSSKADAKDEQRSKIKQ